MPDEPTRTGRRPSREARGLEAAGGDRTEVEPDRRLAYDQTEHGRHRMADPDEISLRDLYLILRRGLPLVMAIALLVAVAAYAWVELGPNVYEAEATVTSSPPSVRMRQDASLLVVPEGDGPPTALALEPVRGHTGETYRTIAESRAVLDATVDRLVSEGVPAPTIEDLEPAAELDAPPGAPNPLIVVHRIRWDDPEVAAAYANAWAQTTVEQARSALLAEVEQMLDVTRSVRAERLAEVEALETSLAELDAEGDRPQERARIERDLALANRAHAAVAELVPLMGYMAQLVPGTTRILDPAAPPSEPAGPSGALVAGLTLVLAGLAATVFVFLREAVREPAGGQADRAPELGRQPPADPGAEEGSSRGRREPPL